MRSSIETRRRRCAWLLPLQRLRPLLTAALSLVLSLASCSKSRRCGAVETCNYLDDDCDGAVDEEFLDADGLYVNDAHCGQCNLSCIDAVDPHGVGTCQRSGGEQDTPLCVLNRCLDGFHQVEGNCVPRNLAQCQPCTDDAQCAARSEGALCVVVGPNDSRCAEACSGESDCPQGFACDSATATEDADRGICTPSPETCYCAGPERDTELACTLASPSGKVCAGVRRCQSDGSLGACAAAFAELCNGQDDDCDDLVDEDYTNDDGVYASLNHCGGCNQPCLIEGPNQVANCTVENATGNTPENRVARCERRCAEGFVDVDGLVLNGCECQLALGGNGPPKAVFGDLDCDGNVDDRRGEFIYVSNSGNDTSDGSYGAPVATIARGVALGQNAGKDVLVAGGNYLGQLEVIAGVSVHGGYAGDFLDRDPSVFPSRLRHAADLGGAPVIRAQALGEATTVSGLVVEGGDALEEGAGSTAVFLDGVGPELRLQDLVVFAGRGAAGRDGDDASELLPLWGLSSAADLQGQAGQAGLDAPSSGPCPRLPGGAGGQKLCSRGTRTRDVSGGEGGDALCPDLGCFNGVPCGNSGCADFTTGGVCDVAAMEASAVANPPAQSGSGLSPGRSGSPAFAQPTNRGICNWCENDFSLRRDGEDGEDGARGGDGGGGEGCSVGNLFATTMGLLRGGEGEDGSDGNDGSGGGGGSAGAGYAVIGGTAGSCVDRSGGSGGGGGSGGCGAPGAQGGTGGGGSVAVVLRLAADSQAGPELGNVRLVTSSGGRGGTGGQGLSGGAGGFGGNGGNATFWCALVGAQGGDGGSGGNGGGGGGGCGGSSMGLYMRGPAAARDYFEGLHGAIAVDLAGVGGLAGDGGSSPGQNGGAGTAGQAEALVFVEDD